MPLEDEPTAPTYEAMRRELERLKAETAAFEKKERRAAIVDALVKAGADRDRATLAVSYLEKSELVKQYGDTLTILVGKGRDRRELLLDGPGAEAWLKTEDGSFCLPEKPQKPDTPQQRPQGEPSMAAVDLERLVLGLPSVPKPNQQRSEPKVGNPEQIALAALRSIF